MFTIYHHIWSFTLEVQLSAQSSCSYMTFYYYSWHLTLFSLKLYMHLVGEKSGVDMLMKTVGKDCTSLFSILFVIPLLYDLSLWAYFICLFLFSNVTIIGMIAFSFFTLFEKISACIAFGVVVKLDKCFLHVFSCLSMRLDLRWEWQNHGEPPRCRQKLHFNKIQTHCSSKCTQLFFTWGIGIMTQIYII